MKKLDFRLAPILFASLLLGACAHIPLGTMWHMAGYSIEDIGELNPADIRVALLLPKDVSLKPGAETLALNLFHHEGDEKPALWLHSSLEKSAEGSSIPLAVPAADARHHWELYRIRQEDYPHFAEFQSQYLAQRDSLDYSRFEVNFDVQPGKKPIKQLRLSVWLKLKPEEAAFELLDEATVSLERNSAIE